jgi:hypothetical protein
MIMTTKTPSTALVATALTKATLNGATKADADRKIRRILLITYLQTLVLSVKRFQRILGLSGSKRGASLEALSQTLAPLDNTVLHGRII